MYKDRFEKVMFLRLVMAGVKTVMVYVVAMACSALLFGCKSCRCAESTDTKDSVSVTEKEWVVEVPCTVYYDVPLFVGHSVVSVGDTSHLENPLAESDAWVDEAGLHHTLTTKPQEVAISATVNEHHKEVARVEKRTITRTVIVKESKTWKYYGKAVLVCLGCVFVGFVLGRVERVQKK